VVSWRVGGGDFFAKVGVSPGGCGKVCSREAAHCLGGTSVYSNKNVQSDDAVIEEDGVVNLKKWFASFAEQGNKQNSSGTGTEESESKKVTPDSQYQVAMVMGYCNESVEAS
jgi:hypothetical protein